jgi:xylulokinase
MGTPLFLGIDVGTSGCKAALFDHRGVKRGVGYVAYQLSRPQPNHVEQDPSEWWRALRGAVEQATAVAGGKDVCALAISSANALVPVGVDGSALRPAVMQLDTRAKKEAEELTSRLDETRLLQECGSTILSGASWLPALRWLSRHEQQTVARTHQFLFPGGWLTLLLTGQSWVDPSRASTSLLFDSRAERWSTELCQVGGVRTSQLPQVGYSTDQAGTLGAEVAAELGLPAGIPVSVGIMDTAAAALGVGAVHEGDSVIVLGTTARIMTVSEEFRPTPRLLSIPYLRGRGWIDMAVVWGAGNALKVAASQWSGEPDFARLDAVVPSAGRPPLSPPTYDLESGTFTSGGSPDPGVAALAIVESLVDSLQLGASLVASHLRGHPSHTVLVGGGTRSGLLSRTLAVRLPGAFTVVPDYDTEPRGAAMVAAVTAGLFTDLATASGAMSAGVLLHC